MSHIAVLGGGAWGIALASRIAKKAKQAVVWSRNPKTVEQINHHKHPKHPNVTFSDSIQATTSLSTALDRAEGVLLCVPSNAFSEVLDQISSPPSFLAWATKGFSKEGDFFSDQIKKRFNQEGVFITGPSFANDVVQDKPTAILLAGPPTKTTFWKDALHTQEFRPYTSEDVLGAQVGAALKNIIAIAVGVCDGLNFGSNAQAAVITRGLKEINTLNFFLGGKSQTLYGLSGLGDVVLTSTNNLSRNRRYGILLTQNKPFDELVEGKEAAAVVHQITQKNQIDLPICEAVYQLTHTQSSPKKIAEDLLKRSPKAEFFEDENKKDP
jgi:glycerol-3-phosphate dehydrogenase (NAD(P)+)